MRSHLVPKFYLKQFTDPASENREKLTPFLWTWNHQTRKWSKRAPKNATIKSGYYELFPDEVGTGGEVERILGSIENRAASIFRNKISQRTAMSPAERMEFALFLATLSARQPRFHELAKDRLSEHAMDFMRNYLTKLSRNPEELAAHNSRSKANPATQESINDLLDHLHEMRLEPPKPTVVMSSLGGVTKAARSLADLCWYVLEAPESEYFITSDNPPKSFVPSSNVFAWPWVLGNPEMEFTCPLSRTQALVVTHGSNGFLAYGPAKFGAVEAINIRTMFFTDSLIFSPVQAFPGAAVLTEAKATEDEADQMMAEIHRRTLLPKLPRLD